MKWSELIKKLKKAGYVYLKDAKGSHEYQKKSVLDLQIKY